MESKLKETLNLLEDLGFCEEMSGLSIVQSPFWEELHSFISQFSYLSQLTADQSNGLVALDPSSNQMTTRTASMALKDTSEEGMTKHLLEDIDSTHQILSSVQVDEFFNLDAANASPLQLPLSLSLMSFEDLAYPTRLKLQSFCSVYSEARKKMVASRMDQFKERLRLFQKDVILPSPLGIQEVEMAFKSQIHQDLAELKQLALHTVHQLCNNNQESSSRDEPLTPSASPTITYPKKGRFPEEHICILEESFKKYQNLLTREEKQRLSALTGLNEVQITSWQVV